MSNWGDQKQTNKQKNGQGHLIGIVFEKETE